MHDERIAASNESNAQDPFAPPSANVDLAAPMPTAGPWRRYLARSLDLAIMCALLIYPMFVLMGARESFALAVAKYAGNEHIIGVLLVPVLIVMEAVVLGLFGRTPGKALLGVRIRDEGGAPLSFAAYLARNVRVWFAGLGIGIPLVALITQIRQYKRLKSGQPASYDAARKTQVEGSPIAAVRVVIAIVLYLSLSVAIFRAYGAEEIITTVRGTKARGDADPVAWRNEATGLSTMIAGFWKHATTDSETGTMTVTFTEPLDQAAVAITYEDVADYSLDDYLQAFIEVTADQFHLDGRGSDGKRLTKNGHEAWSCAGSMPGHLNMRCELTIAKVGERFWRTLKIQGKPTSATDRIANDLRDALWTTVK